MKIYCNFKTTFSYFLYYRLGIGITDNNVIKFKAKIQKIFQTWFAYYNADCLPCHNLLEITYKTGFSGWFEGLLLFSSTSNPPYFHIYKSKKIQWPILTDKNWHWKKFLFLLFFKSVLICVTSRCMYEYDVVGGSFVNLSPPKESYTAVLLLSYGKHIWYKYANL